MSPRRETLLHGSLGGGLDIDGKHTYRRAWRNGLSGHSPGVGVGQGSVLPKLDRDLLSKAAEISPQARGKGEPASTGTRRGLVHVGQDGRQLGHHRPEAKVAVRASSQEGALLVRHRAIEKGRLISKKHSAPVHESFDAHLSGKLFLLVIQTYTLKDQGQTAEALDETHCFPAESLRFE